MLLNNFYKIMILSDTNLLTVENNPWYSASLQSKYIKITDIRSPLQKISAIGKACLNQIRVIALLAKHFVEFFSRREGLFIKPKKTVDTWEYDNKDFPWTDNSDSEGLYLFVHGLRSTPLVWGGYLKELEKDKPNSHFIAPIIAKRGNCSLEVAAEPLLHIVQDYLKKFPGKPITMIGTSNGSRIISYIENNLTTEEMEGATLNVVSIAGVHYGTKVVDWLEKLHLLPISTLDSKLSKEFKWGSVFAKKLLKDWSQKQNEWKENGINVRHLFCTTLEDEKVISRSSSLPLLSNATCHYFVYNGENHQTIVTKAQKDVCKWVKQQ